MSDEAYIMSGCITIIIPKPFMSFTHHLIPRYRHLLASITHMNPSVFYYYGLESDPEILRFAIHTRMVVVTLRARFAPIGPSPLSKHLLILLFCLLESKCWSTYNIFNIHGNSIQPNGIPLVDETQINLIQFHDARNPGFGISYIWLPIFIRPLHYATKLLYHTIYKDEEEEDDILIYTTC